MRSKNEDVMNNIVDFIDEYYFSYNSVPTMQEIAEVVGLDKSNVSRYVQEMKDKGMLEIASGWRSIKTDKIRKTLSDIMRVPIVGSIACGSSMLAQQNIESYITISASFLGQGKFFALKARGNSMVNANIHDGDFVIVRQQDTANAGEIIVSLIDDAATLKRFYIDKRRRKVRLHPENDEMQDMYFDNIAIQGVVKKIVKDAQ